MNKEQLWYLRSGYGFSVLFVLLGLFLSIFELTRQFVPIVFILLCVLWAITLLHIFIWKDIKRVDKDG